MPDDLEGVYILYDSDDNPLYVGESGRMKGRLKAHLSNYNAFQRELIQRIEIIPFVEKTTRKERMVVEKMFINLLNPRFNEGNKKRDFFNPKFELKIVANGWGINRVDDLTLEQMKEL